MARGSAKTLEHLISRQSVSLAVQRQILLAGPGKQQAGGVPQHPVAGEQGKRMAIGPPGVTLDHFHAQAQVILGGRPRFGHPAEQHQLGLAAVIERAAQPFRAALRQSQLRFEVREVG